MLYANDLSIHRARLRRYKKVLVVFPHPDDETNVAGTLWRLHQLHTPVTLAVLTKGERGTTDAHMDPELKGIRSHEMREASRILGVTNLVQKDFGDGEVAEKRGEVTAFIQKLILDERPDVVITYDLAGLYGHSDHIACAEIVTTLVKDRHPGIELWYTTLPKHLLAMIHLPTHMARDPKFAARRAVATMRIPCTLGTIAKLRAVYAHHSQLASFKSSMPANLPLWAVYSMQVSEYYQRIQ